MGYWSSAKYSWEKSFLFARINFFIHFSCQFFVIFLLTNFISTTIILICFLILPHLFECISQPPIRNCLLLVKINRLLKTLHCIRKLSQPKVCCSFIMIVYRMLGLNINCSVMTLDGFLVLFQFIISSP